MPVRNRPPLKPGMACRDYTDDLALGVRSRPGGQGVVTWCRSYTGGGMVTWCRSYTDDLPLGVRPPMKPGTACRSFTDGPPTGE